VELSKTVALTAIVFIVVLILTSGISLGGGDRSRESAKKPNEAAFERSRAHQAARPAGTEYGPTKPPRRHVATGACQYKPVMTEADMQACRAVRRK
jgi:hypothetical protein